MDRTVFILLVAAAGLVAGFALFQFSQSPGYCQQVEKDIKQEKTFNGTLSCYPPGEAGENFNVSDAVENSTSLECVCVNRFMGEERVFTINVAN